MFCVRLSVSRIMIFLFSSINIPLAKKHKSPVFFLCHTVWLVCWNFLCDCYNSSAAPGHLSQSFPGEKQGWLSIQFFFKIKRSQDLVQMCKIYIYTYTHYYNCIYALLVPRCILDHLSVYVCFLAELAQHLQYIGMNITISSTPWPAHLATSPLQIGWKRNEFESFRVRFFTKKTGKEMEQLTAYNHKNWWQHPTALWVSRDRKTPRKTAPGAIPGATTRARTNFFQRRVALRQLCKASSKCATKARIISETYTSWLSWRSWLSWLLTF